MNTLEARQVLAAELKTYRAKPYAELVQLRGGAIVSEQIGPSGAHYQLEVQVMWDDQSNGAIRVIGSVDDGGWRAFMPLTESFIKLPTGDLVGE